MFEGCSGCCISLILIPVLCCVLIAGAVIYVYATAPEPPISDNFKPSEAEARAFEQAINAATNQAATQRAFTLMFNERQLSSWMSLRGEEFAKKNNNNFPFENVQVGLDEGVMTFYAEFASTGLKLPIKVIIRPRVNAQGKLEMDIEKAHLGGLSVPKFILNGVTAQFEDALVKPFDDLPGNYALYPNNLSVQGGTFVVPGRVQ